jgi:hypothetical protein
MEVVTPEFGSEITPEYLKWLGDRLDDFREPEDGGKKQTERDFFIERYLRIRTKKKNQTALILNRAQQSYSARSGKRNIVLKARQLGITTYIAARFFAQTISQRGILSMQVTHDRESAEDIFRMCGDSGKIYRITSAKGF